MTAQADKLEDNRLRAEMRSLGYKVVKGHDTDFGEIWHMTAPHVSDTIYLAISETEGWERASEHWHATAAKASLKDVSTQPDQQLAVEQGDVAIPRALFDFLMGTGEIDGTSFGDLNAGMPGRFWWRALLRTAEVNTRAASSHTAAIEEARREAFEMAAKVAENYVCENQAWSTPAGSLGDYLAAAIRKLEP